MPGFATFLPADPPAWLALGLYALGSVVVLLLTCVLYARLTRRDGSAYRMPLPPAPVKKNSWDIILKDGP